MSHTQFGSELKLLKIENCIYSILEKETNILKYERRIFILKSAYVFRNKYMQMHASNVSNFDLELFLYLNFSIYCLVLSVRSTVHS